MSVLPSVLEGKKIQIREKGTLWLVVKRGKVIQRRIKKAEVNAQAGSMNIEEKVPETWR